MAQFPQMPDYIGLNTPIGKELSIKNLQVIGSLPDDIRGAFFRAVPDPAVVPRFPETDLNSDGMICRVLFNDNGSVDYDIRYVQTARYLAEKAAGKALFGRYRNPFTDDPSVQGVDRTVSNTTPVWHAGRLIMTKEDGRGYEINPHTLETIGSYDFAGKLKSQTMTAHVRVDPQTGEMFFFGYECAGLASPKVAYCVADKTGQLISEQWFDAPYCGLMHDFVITRNYAVFPVFPTTCDLERLKAGGAHWVHHQDLESWVGVMPRHGDVSQLRWFKGPKGVSVFHMINGFEDDQGRIHIDQHISETNAFPFMRAASGIDIAQSDIKGGLVRWTIDLNSKDAAIQETMLGPPGDLPRLPDADQGRPYQRAWYLTMNPDMQGPPLFGGPVGVVMNALLSFEPQTGRITMMPLPPAHGLNEVVHVASATPGHAGWLLVVIQAEGADGSQKNETWVLDAADITKPPVAKVIMPAPMRPQVHGWWVSSKELAKSVVGFPLP